MHPNPTYRRNQFSLFPSFSLRYKKKNYYVDQLWNILLIFVSLEKLEKVSHSNETQT